VRQLGHALDYLCVISPEHFERSRPDRRFPLPDAMLNEHGGSISYCRAILEDAEAKYLPVVARRLSLRPTSAS
jgi:hypothetical protein